MDCPAFAPNIFPKISEIFQIFSRSQPTQNILGNIVQQIPILLQAFFPQFFMIHPYIFFLIVWCNAIKVGIKKTPYYCIRKDYHCNFHLDFFGWFQGLESVFFQLFGQESLDFFSSSKNSQVSLFFPIFQPNNFLNVFCDIFYVRLSFTEYC